MGSFAAGAGTRFVVTSASSQSSGTALTGPITATAGTATTNTPAFDITQTWNNAGVTFTGFRFNVTDTASNANSLLMDLQIGGSSRFNVSKSGRVAVNGGYGFLSAPNANYGFIGYSSGWYWNDSGNVSLGYVNSKFMFQSSGTAPGFGWGNLVAGTYDLALAYDAANTLAQRNGVNAQTFRIYNTFTDASNYERGIFGWVGNEFQIGTERAGTGVARSLYLNSASNVFVACANAAEIRFYNAAAVSWKISGSSHFLAGVDNTYDIGATGASRPRNVFWAGYQEMSEMTAPAAPAVNTVRIYAEDNGAGKTRLMARFNTGAAQQIAIEP